jgi:hypothetical protein
MSTLFLAVTAPQLRREGSVRVGPQGRIGRVNVRGAECAEFRVEEPVKPSAGSPMPSAREMVREPRAVRVPPS